MFLLRDKKKSSLNYPQYPLLSGALSHSKFCLRCLGILSDNHFYFLASLITTLSDLNYPISSVIRQSFFLPKQSQRSRSVLQDGSRSLGLFRKGKIGIIAKFHRTDLVI